MISVLIASAIAASLASDLQELAKLPGEPSIVSAAGLDSAGEPILTLENPSAFDPQSRRKRVIVFAAAGDERTAAAVLALVRWMKTSAPADVRNGWLMSAVPAAMREDRPDGSHCRWSRFQAPDISIEIVGEGSRPIGDCADAHHWVVDSTRRDVTSMLRAAESSSAHQTIATRIDRDPLTIAKLLAPKYPGEPSISYIPALSWANTLTLATKINDPALRAKVEQQIKPWMSGEKELFGNRIQLTAVAGTLVFADLAKSGDEAAKALAIKGAEAASKLREGDVYEYGGGWTDDMFMASVVLARTSSLPGRATNIDLAAKMLIAYAGRLQRPDGLFNHATNGPAAWGRGNGFATLGLMEALTVMPQNHPLRARILDIYKRHMEALRVQAAPDGMWREVIDEPGSYREESATAIILTSMARGVRLGWLDQSYAPIVQRAWHGVAAHVAEDGAIIDVCTSTGSGPTKKYYLDRAAITGADDRGGAMALMAAMEMLN